MHAIQRVPRILIVALAGLLLITAPPANGQESKETTCEGKFKGRKKPTREEITKILEDHLEWLTSKGKKGRRADLCEANLSEADLRGARLPMANLSNADLSKTDLTDANMSGARLFQATGRGAGLWLANLHGADLREADLREASLSMTDLIKANLSEADLRGARLRMANLSNADLSKTDLRGALLREADLSGADLRGADLRRADFTSARFEPEHINPHLLIGAKGLSSIQFENIEAVVQLRKALKEASLHSEERALTAAIRKYRLKEEPRYVQFFESFLLGGWLTDYGAQPWWCLGVLGILVVLFPFPYMSAIAGRGRSGIWATLPEDRVHKGRRTPKPIRLTVKNLPGASARILSKPPNPPIPILEEEPFARWFRVLRIALYFSLLSAFRIGWRELNVGNWITRMQFREYILRATGWVRFVSGLQSLISVYLIALWILTYFGRPFE